MPSVPVHTGPSLEKRALGAARLEGVRRRRALIKRRVSAFAALVLVVVWAVVLAETWRPQAADPASPGDSAVQSSISYDTAPAPMQVTPSPAPVVSSQS